MGGKKKGKEELNNKTHVITKTIKTTHEKKGY